MCSSEQAPGYLLLTMRLSGDCIVDLPDIPRPARRDWTAAGRSGELIVAQHLGSRKQCGAFVRERLRDRRGTADSVRQPFLYEVKVRPRHGVARYLPLVSTLLGLLFLLLNQESAK